MGIPYKKKSSKNLKLLELYYDFPTKTLLISEKAQFKGFLSCIFMPIAGLEPVTYALRVRCSTS